MRKATSELATELNVVVECRDGTSIIPEAEALRQQTGESRLDWAIH